MIDHWVISLKEKAQPLCTLVWTRYVYLYLFGGIFFSFLAGVFAQKPVILYTLDAVLFFPIFVAHVHEWKIKRLFQTATFWGFFKSVVLIGGVLALGDSLDRLVDRGLVYHREAMQWTLTGEGDMGVPETFIPQHIIGALKVLVSAAASCGLFALIGGSRELNIMNFHVAKLIQKSVHPLYALAFAWPPWSIIRGWAYLALMVGAAKFFLILIRRHAPNWKPVIFYSAFGLLGAAIDVILKASLAPYWRTLLLKSF